LCKGITEDNEDREDGAGAIAWNIDRKSSGSEIIMNGYRKMPAKIINKTPRRANHNTLCVDYS